MFLAKLKIQILKEKRQREFLEAHKIKQQRVGNVWWMDYSFARTLDRSQVNLGQFSKCPEISIQQKKKLKNLNVRLESCPDLTQEFILNNPKYDWSSMSLLSHQCITFEFIRKHCMHDYSNTKGKFIITPQAVADNPNISFEQFKSLFPETSWNHYARNPNFSLEIIRKYPRIEWSQHESSKTLPPEHLGSQITIDHRQMTLELYLKTPNITNDMLWIGCFNPKLAYELIQGKHRAHPDQAGFLNDIHYGTRCRAIDREYDQLCEYYRWECARVCFDKWLNNCRQSGGRTYFRYSLGYLRRTNPEKAEKLKLLLEKRWPNRSQKKKITKEIITLLELGTISLE
jgi:hypothetical protein